MSKLVSKFSVIGKEQSSSEAAGNYTLVNIEFEYRGAMHDGQIIVTESGITTFSFMKKHGATRQSGLLVRDKIRHEIISEYNATNFVNELVESTAGHEEQTVVKEDTMQVQNSMDLMLSELKDNHGITSEYRKNIIFNEMVFSKGDHHIVFPLETVKREPEYVKQNVLKHFEKALNIRNADELIKRFENFTGLTINTLYNDDNKPLYFIVDGDKYINIYIKWLVDVDRRLYKFVRDNFTKKINTANLVKRIDDIHRTLWNAGYDTSTYDRMESLTVKYFDEYRFIVMSEIFFLSDVEILQYVEKLFRSGGDE